MLWQFPPMYLVLNARFWPILTPPPPPCTTLRAATHPPTGRGPQPAPRRPPYIHLISSLIIIYAFVFFARFCWSRYAQSPFNVRRPSLLENKPPKRSACGGRFYEEKSKNRVFLDPPSWGQKSGFFPNFWKKSVFTAFQTACN